MMDQWCVVELLGHRTVLGMVTECEIAGAGFLKVDVAASAGGFEATQYYSPGSVYCLTPTTEEAIRARLGRVRSVMPLGAWVEEPDDEAAEATEPEFDPFSN